MLRELRLEIVHSQRSGSSNDSTNLDFMFFTFVLYWTMIAIIVILVGDPADL